MAYDPIDEHASIAYIAMHAHFSHFPNLPYPSNNYLAEEYDKGRYQEIHLLVYNFPYQDLLLAGI